MSGCRVKLRKNFHVGDPQQGTGCPLCMLKWCMDAWCTRSIDYAVVSAVLRWLVYIAAHAVICMRCIWWSVKTLGRLRCRNWKLQVGVHWSELHGARDFIWLATSVRCKPCLLYPKCYPLPTAKPISPGWFCTPLRSLGLLYYRHRHLSSSFQDFLSEKQLQSVG